MKKLILILLFSASMFSSSSYAEWTKVSSMDGNTFYVDFERIREHDGYVYFWELLNYLKPQYGDLSVKVYKQGDCKLFGYKGLSYSYYIEPMGRGTSSTSSNKPDKEWSYPPPDSSFEIALKQVCNR
jgi:hypothetical protein